MLYWDLQYLVNLCEKGTFIMGSAAETINEAFFLVIVHLIFLNLIHTC